MLKDTEIIESANLVTLENTGELTGSRYKVRLIEGDKLGSTGYYPAEMLRRDGPKIFLKGTPMYLDHISAEETKRGSFGSITNFAGELAEDAYYENDGLYATVEVFEHERPRIKSLKDRIGISIRARGRTETTIIDGKQVPVFKELLLARSADFVVRAGAGGKIVETLESAIEENSESASDIEEGRENMDEVLAELKAMRTDFSSRLTNLEEAAKAPVVEKEAEESEVDYDKAIEIAEAFVSSTLDSDGRKRVLELHRANKKPIAELIEAEEAYIKKASAASAEVEGLEESIEEEIEAQESATFKLPTVWAKKESK